jgi:protein-tyrosine phosphatase
VKILVVCSGNICRSPMGEVILQDLGNAAGLSLEVHSAGTLDIDGAEASFFGVVACREHGLDLENFRSTSLSNVPLADFDQVLVMEPKHEVRVRELMGRLDIPIHFVRKFSGSEDAQLETLTQVPDPVGQDLPVYQASFVLIRRCMQGYVAMLKAQS